MKEDASRLGPLLGSLHDKMDNRSGAILAEGAASDILFVVFDSKSQGRSGTTL